MHAHHATHAHSMCACSMRAPAQHNMRAAMLHLRVGRALHAHVMYMLMHTSGPAHHMLMQTLTCRCGGSLVIAAIVAHSRALRSLLSVSGGAQDGVHYIQCLSLIHI
eukprot:8577103-Alexandrium_andersonii.AAC.1